MVSGLDALGKAMVAFQTLYTPHEDLLKHMSAEMQQKVAEALQRFQDNLQKLNT